MSKITLAKALKEKNKLVHEMKKTLQRVHSSNSFIKENKENVIYDAKNELQKYFDLKEKLITLKDKINVANMPIQSIIYSLSEYKDIISNIQSISTNKGILYGGRYSDVEGKIEYDSFVSKQEIDEFVELYEKKIEDLQEKVDQFNHSTYIEI